MKELVTNIIMCTEANLGGEEGRRGSMGGSVSKIVYPIIEPACTTLIGTMNNLTKVK